MDGDLDLRVRDRRDELHSDRQRAPISPDQSGFAVFRNWLGGFFASLWPARAHRQPVHVTQRRAEPKF